MCLYCLSCRTVTPVASSQDVRVAALQGWRARPRRANGRACLVAFGPHARCTTPPQAERLTRHAAAPRRRSGSPAFSCSRGLRASLVPTVRRPVSQASLSGPALLTQPRPSRCIRRHARARSIALCSASGASIPGPGIHRWQPSHRYAAAPVRTAVTWPHAAHATSTLGWSCIAIKCRFTRRWPSSRLPSSHDRPSLLQRLRPSRLADARR